MAFSYASTSLVFEVWRCKIVPSGQLLLQSIFLERHAYDIIMGRATDEVSLQVGRDGGAALADQMIILVDVGGGVKDEGDELVGDEVLGHEGADAVVVHRFAGNGHKESVLLQVARHLQHFRTDDDILQAIVLLRPVAWLRWQEVKDEFLGRIGFHVLRICQQALAVSLWQVAEIVSRPAVEDRIRLTELPVHIFPQHQVDVVGLAGQWREVEDEAFVTRIFQHHEEVGRCGLLRLKY